MLSAFVRFLERRGSWRMIARRNHQTGELERYLKRFYLIRSPWFGVFIHQFWSSDEEDVHCHPWNNFTFVLRGGYHEHNASGECYWRPPGFFRFRQAEVFHRISVGPHSRGHAWSLFVTFRRYRKWGFMTKEGWIEATRYGEMHNNPVEVQGVHYKLEGWLLPRVTRLVPQLVD